MIWNNKLSITELKMIILDKDDDILIDKTRKENAQKDKTRQENAQTEKKGDKTNEISFTNTSFYKFLTKSSFRKYNR